MVRLSVVIREKEQGKRKETAEEEGDFLLLIQQIGPRLVERPQTRFIVSVPVAEESPHKQWSLLDLLQCHDNMSTSFGSQEGGGEGGKVKQRKIMTAEGWRS